MEKPKCKLCGDRHYGLCVIVHQGETIAQPPMPELDGVAITAAVELGASLARSPGTFDRLAYQREYMRKRRAAAKAGS